MSECKFVVIYVDSFVLSVSSVENLTRYHGGVCNCDCDCDSRLRIEIKVNLLSYHLILMPFLVMELAIARTLRLNVAPPTCWKRTTCWRCQIVYSELIVVDTLREKRSLTTLMLGFFHNEAKKIMHLKEGLNQNWNEDALYAQLRKSTTFSIENCALRNSHGYFNPI